MSIHHPSSDEELIALVGRAREEGLTLRVCGDGHSVAHAIYADPLGAIANKVKQPVPADGKNINVVLDRYGENGTPSYRVLCPDSRLIEVDGGMRLGRTPGETEPSGLLQRLDREHGWMLCSTGGIAHQTVAGFVATASAGGSLQFSVNELVRGVTLIDGSGAEVSIDEGHDDFHAVVPHLGLLGIVTKVRLRCCPAFTVKGRQVTSSPREAGLDLSGECVGTPLAEFLRTTQYARIDWWPQRGCERVRVWTGAGAGGPKKGFKPKEFELFKAGDQLRAGIALTALGNLHDAERMKAQLRELVDRATALLSDGTRSIEAAVVPDLAPELRRMGLLGRWVASQVDDVVGGGRRFAGEDRARTSWVERLLMAILPTWLPRLLIRWLLPSFFAKLLDRFAENGCQEFHDHAWRVLPMDDAVDDVYLPIEFTEIWVPLKRAADAIRHLNAYFDAATSEREALARTGTFEIELYASKASEFWLDTAFSDGSDAWSEGALRINPYWYGRNAADPAQAFFLPFWDLLRATDIPYRLHWGKFLPPVAQHPWWPAKIRAQYPHWDDFMAVRKRHDPDDIFVNDYWRAQLGLTRTRIADLHCHYPMRVHSDRSPAAVAERRRCSGRWFWLDRARCLVMRGLAQVFNHASFSATWRVTFRGLQAARAGLVLSTLYDPADELLVRPGKQQPRPAAFGALLCQLGCVEAELSRADPEQRSHVVVKSRVQLEQALGTGRMAFVHCVEGGLYLGDSECAVKQNVATLADHGVAYITLAHLFYRGIASNACALPMISDKCYDRIFHQRERGLSTLGRAAVEAMYEHKMLIDITHMDAAALNATLDKLDTLDTETATDPKEHPIIASHAGYRFGDLAYMLDAVAIQKIARRGGVIGLILAKHQLQNGLCKRKIRESRFYALDCHIRKIHAITGSHEHTCIGSDHDGFIKPTVSRIHGSAELGEIEQWLRDEYPTDVADAILFRNAERVVASALR